MRKAIVSFASLCLAICAMPALGDEINLQYTTFGGNTATSEGPLTPEMGTAVVNGASAVLTSNNAEVGAVWMDTGLNSQANNVTLKFDIDILSQAASGYGQDFGGAQTLGGVRIFETADWAESFQFMPTSTTTGYFAFRNADATNATGIANYNTNTNYHVKLDIDYVAHTVDAYINDLLAYSDYPLRPGNVAGGTTSEIFVYLNGASGDGVHNSFKIGDTPVAVVPLPSAASGGLVCMGILGACKLVRRRAIAATV